MRAAILSVRMSFPLSRALLAMLLLVVSNSAVCAPAVSGGLPPPGIFPDETALGAQIWDFARWRDTLLELYGQPATGMLWFTGAGPSAPAAAMLAELRAAAVRGLIPSDYDVQTIEQRAARSAALTPTERMNLDELFSATVARFVTDLHFGRIPIAAEGRPLDLQGAALDLPSILRALASEADPGVMLDQLEPQLRHYRLLKNALSTYRALGEPAQVLKIELSMERARWLPSPLSRPPIVVNIPQFRLFAFRTTQDNRSDILQMNVIVGSAFKGRQTPVFAALMRYIVLNPYWDVPASILRAELLPEIRRNAAWIASNGYQMVLGQGDDAEPQEPTAENVARLAAGELRLRQLPGPMNALGRVKFMLPNRYNVYLHDTPARALFSRQRRAFSHGCIRLDAPMDLLNLLLRDSPDWTSDRIARALSSGVPTRIPLPDAVPVYIVYGTALALEDGRTLFFDDIYRQDAPLEKRLRSRRRDSQKH